METEQNVALFKKVIEKSPQAILIVNTKQHSVVYHNKIADQFFGGQLDHLIGEETYIRLFFSEKEIQFELSVSTKGEPRVGVVSARTLSWNRTPSEYRVLYINELTSSKFSTAESYIDELTSIPRRPLFDQRMEEAIALADENKGVFGLLFLDLDGFKLINDTYGHSAGDQVLKIATQRMQACIRKDDVLARLGGDEFGIILLNVQDIDNMGNIAEKIIQTLEQEMKIEQDQSCFISASIGVSTFPHDGRDRKILTQNADRAMYAVKHDRGKGNYAYYADGIVEQYQKRKQTESEIKKALLETDRLILYFMPQIDIETGGLCAVEALTYLQKTAGDIMAPSEFIPVAERSNLIISLEQLVFDKAVQQSLQWFDKLEAAKHFRLIVNLSSRHFTTGDSLETIDYLLEHVGIKPELLDLEISETAMSNDPKAIKKLYDVRQKNVHITLDNYGSKATSLISLKRFPISAVKMDRTFVRNIVEDSTDRAIVKHTIRLANDLGLKTIAQGVETQEQLYLLKNWGCNEAQGYLFSKALRVDAFSDYVLGFEPTITKNGF